MIDEQFIVYPKKFPPVFKMGRCDACGLQQPLCDLGKAKLVCRMGCSYSSEIITNRDSVFLRKHLKRQKESIDNLSKEIDRLKGNFDSAIENHWKVKKANLVMNEWYKFKRAVEEGRLVWRDESIGDRTEGT